MTLCQSGQFCLWKGKRWILLKLFKGRGAMEPCKPSCDWFQASLQNPRILRDILETSLDFADGWTQYTEKHSNTEKSGPWCQRLWTGQSIPPLQYHPEMVLRTNIENSKCILKLRVSSHLSFLTFSQVSIEVRLTSP